MLDGSSRRWQSPEQSCSKAAADHTDEKIHNKPCCNFEFLLENLDLFKLFKQPTHFHNNEFQAMYVYCM